MSARHDERKDFRESAQLRKLAQSLFEDSERQNALIEAVALGESKKPAIIWLTERPEPPPFPSAERASWMPAFVDLPSGDVRPGAHELHTAGAYYCLDGSSVFDAVSMLAQSAPSPAVLDLCAAPGGKSIFASRALHPSLLVSNEVIGKRSASLISNLERCSLPATVVRADVKQLAEEWQSMFDLLIIDAPCSGQSLVARGQDAPGCFHPAVINKCSNRQKRILATSADIAAGGGHIAYMTCTYSREENEGVVEWFLKRFPEFESVAVPALEAHRSALSDSYCYRLFPYEGFGAGGFTSLLRRTGSTAKRAPVLGGIRKLRVISASSALASEN